MSDFENLLNEEKHDTGDTDRERKISNRLAEIEQAIVDGYMVQSVEDRDCVYLVAKDFADNEALAVPKQVVADMFVDDPEIYCEWKNGYNQYIAKKEGQKLFPITQGRKLGGKK